MAWRDDPWPEVFDADYLRFYEDPLEERADRETDLIARLLGLEAGAELLDAPCGHGRIANRLAAKGVRVVGLDNNPAFLERARTDAAAMGVEVEYVLGDLRDLRLSRSFDAALNWFTSFGYFDEAANRRLLGAYRGLLRREHASWSSSSTETSFCGCSRLAEHRSSTSRSAATTS